LVWHILRFTSSKHHSRSTSDNK